MKLQNPHLLAQIGLDPGQDETELSRAVEELLDDSANLEESVFWSSLKWSHQEGVEEIPLFVEIWISTLCEAHSPYSILKFNGTNVGLVILDSILDSGYVDVLGAIDLDGDIGAQVESVLGSYFEDVGIGVPSGLLIEANGVVNEAALRNAYWRSDSCRFAGKQAFETDFNEALDYGRRQEPH